MRAAIAGGPEGCGVLLTVLLCFGVIFAVLDADHLSRVEGAAFTRRRSLTAASPLAAFPETQRNKGKKQAASKETEGGEYMCFKYITNRLLMHAYICRCSTYGNPVFRNAVLPLR